LGELVGSLELNRVAYLIVNALSSVTGSWINDYIITIYSTMNGFETGDKGRRLIKITHHY
jgi:hypothetical protein